MIFTPPECPICGARNQFFGEHVPESSHKLNRGLTCGSSWILKYRGYACTCCGLMSDDDLTLCPACQSIESFEQVTVTVENTDGMVRTRVTNSWYLPWWSLALFVSLSYSLILLAICSVL